MKICDLVRDRTLTSWPSLQTDCRNRLKGTFGVVLEHYMSSERDI
jgi:hypothetical protein